MLSRAPGIRIGTSECYNVWIDTSNYMPEMDMMICEPS